MADSSSPRKTTIGDSDIIEIMNSRFGTKPLVMYYLKRAKDAASRAKVDLSGQNNEKFTAEAQTVIENVDMLWKILGDDNKQV